MNNKLLLLMALIIGLTLCPLPVGALQYDFSNNNGSWFDYTSGLDSSYYKDDLTQSTYNRDFETDFSISVNTTYTTECSDNYCLVNNANDTYTNTFERSSSEAYEGSYSGKFNYNSGGYTKHLFFESETIGDANLSFYYKTDGVDYPSDFDLRIGVIDQNFLTTSDITNFYTLETLSVVSDWTYVSVNIPSGQTKLSFYIDHTGGFIENADVYIDDIKITRNNTGTFRTTDPQYCNSINSCSNIEKHLPANNLGSLYWVVDYVADATCSYYKNGVSQGNLTEGSNGMYYTEIDEYVTSGFYSDVNLSAECVKPPYAPKDFYTSSRLYRYNNVSGGNFEDSFSLDGWSEGVSCSGNWCHDIVSSSPASPSDVVTKWVSDGNHGLKYVSKATQYPSVSLEKEFFYNGVDSEQEGATISFDYKFIKAGKEFLQYEEIDASYGYYNDSNNFIEVGVLNNSSTDWNTVSFDIPAGTGNRFAIRSYEKNDGDGANTVSVDSLFYIDNVMSDLALRDADLTGDNNLTSNYGLRGTNYTFTSDYETETGASILGADCNLTIGTTDYDMSYNSDTGLYEYSTALVSDGVHSVEHVCASDDFTEETESYSIEIVSPTSSVLTFNPISNIKSYSLSDFAPEVDIVSQNNEDNIEFSVYAQEDDYDVLFNFDSYLKDKFYLVYTSDDGVDYALNESLTYGQALTYDDPLQRIPLKNKFANSFETNLTNSAVIEYYKLKPITPPVFYKTISNNDDWIHFNTPSIYEDSNNVKWDLFQDSNYSNMKSQTTYFIPDLTSTDLNTPYEFMFTAYASENHEIQAGYVYNGVEIETEINLSTTPTTYSIPINPTDFDSKLILKSSSDNDARVYINNYVLMPKAYFTNRLNVYKKNGEELDAILNNGSSVIYAQEGKDLIFNTKAFDLDGDLKTLRIEALINSTTVNTKEYKLSDATEEEKVFEWEKLITGVIDINGYYNNPSAFRDLTFKATLINNDDEEVSEQFKEIKLMPYPYFSNDIDVFVSSLRNKVGENPAFRFSINQDLPEQFKGLKVSIWDSDSSLSSPDYEDYIYEDQLKCGANCSKDLIIDDFVYEKEDNYKAQFTLLLGTENENTDNPLTNFFEPVNVIYEEYETARIFQVFQRNDKTYRNDEKTELVMQLRDNENNNLKDRTDVYLTLDICSSDTGACDSNGTTEFKPKFHYFDDTTGYNYYYWNSVFYQDDGSLFEDSNYIRLQGHINDQYYSHDDAEIPVVTLGDKCNDVDFNDIGSFLYNFFLGDITGCSDPANAVIELGDAEEERILIDSDHDVVGSTNQSLICLKPDNDSYFDTLEQDLFCTIIYRRSEKSIDKFKFYIGNENSDYSKTGDEKQFIEFTIPAEDVVFNDPYLLKQALNNKYDTSIDTIGELFYYGVDDIFTGIANPLSEVPTALTDTGIIKNVNWDLNFDGEIDPTTVTGFFFLKLDGLKVTNQYDYIYSYPELETLDPKEFREFINRKNAFLPEKETIVTVFASDNQQVEKFKTPSPIVIFETPSKNNVKSSAEDQNSVTVSVPTSLSFSFISDMFYNNGQNIDRVKIPMNLTQEISKTFTWGSVEECVEDPAKCIKNNWFLIFILLGFALVVSLIYYNFKSKGA